MHAKRLLRTSCIAICLTAIGLCGCSDDSRPAVEATVPSSQTVTDTSRPTSVIDDPNAATLEEIVLERVRELDPAAQTSQDSFDDATVEAIVRSQRIIVHVAGRGPLSAGEIGPSRSFGAIDAVPVDGGPNGRIWRFKCTLPRFGLRTVELWFADDPAPLVPAIYDTLHCVSG